MLSNSAKLEKDDAAAECLDTSMAGMRDYIIITAYPAIPAEVKSEGRSAVETYRKEKYSEKLADLAEEIRDKVLSNHGGSIIREGGERNADIIVRTTCAGLEALKEIESIGRISQTIDFDNLSLQPDGISNVPPGVCWSRPA